MRERSVVTPEDVRLVVAGGDQFLVVCRSLPPRGTGSCLPAVGQQPGY